MNMAAENLAALNERYEEVKDLYNCLRSVRHATNDGMGGNHLIDDKCSFDSNDASEMALPSLFDQTDVAGGGQGDANVDDRCIPTFTVRQYSS
jgi:hypothetical protein